MRAALLAAFVVSSLASASVGAQRQFQLYARIADDTGGPAAAQDGIVRMVVPMAAGGPADFVARTISEKLREKLGASVIIENKPGANGALGGMAVAAAPPDGKTLLFATSGLLTITPTLEQKSNFNPASDLTPITNVVVNGTALVVRADHPANNIAELVAISKKGPKPVTLGSAGFGNILHLYVEVLKDATKRSPKRSRSGRSAGPKVRPRWVTEGSGGEPTLTAD